NARGFANDWWDSIPRAATARAQPAIRWTRVHTRRTDVVAGASEPMLYLYAEREALPVATFTAVQYLRDRTDGENADDLREIVQAGGARYVLVQSPGELAAARALAADTAARPRLTPVDSAGGLYVFAVGDAPPPAAPPAAPTDSVTR
ncbi:MAG TPA: hypothetical protein VFT41_02725, partial [Gemmatimonadaceae bacterium]|nr:hypothetical protein [Gemmatimonadaceae bacterium]